MPDCRISAPPDSSLGSGRTSANKLPSSLDRSPSTLANIRIQRSPQSPVDALFCPHLAPLLLSVPGSLLSLPIRFALPQSIPLAPIPPLSDCSRLSPFLSPLELHLSFLSHRSSFVCTTTTPLFPTTHVSTRSLHRPSRELLRSIRSTTHSDSPGDLG